MGMMKIVVKMMLVFTVANASYGVRPDIASRLAKVPRVTSRSMYLLKSSKTGRLFSSTLRSIVWRTVRPRTTCAYNSSPAIRQRNVQNQMAYQQQEDSLVDLYFEQIHKNAGYRKAFMGRE